MKKFKFLYLCLCSILIIVVLGGCGSTTASSQSSSNTEVTDAKGALNGVTLKVGTSGLFPPFTYYDDNSNLIGFDVDLINKLKEYLGFEFENGNIQAMSYSALSTSVNNGKLDLAIGAFCETEQRKEIMNFSTPYYDINQFVMVNKESSPSEIKSIEDLKSGKYSVAVETGTPSHVFAQTYIPGDKIVPFDEITTAYQSLEDSKVDALIQEGPAVFYYIKTQPDTKLTSVGEGFNEFNLKYAAAISFNATDKLNLLNIVNKAIKDFEEDGTLEALKEKWDV